MKNPFKKLMISNDETIIDRCKGAIIGAWLGDAIGAVLEFQGVPNVSSLRAAFELRGGGLHHAGPGQTTDDSELTCCLLRGLSNSSNLNLNYIAEQYGNWITSRPFDLGGSLRNSLPKAANLKSHVAEMVRRGAAKNQDSQSNGCLMRISPLAVWCRNLSPADIVKAVKEEVSLSHPNVTVQLACCFHVMAIGMLINTRDRRSSYMRTKEEMEPYMNNEIREWVGLIEAESIDLPVNKASGWAKIAFVYGFRSLLAGDRYLEAVEKILSGGGDTDTNACIIGSLIASADGLSALPIEKVNRVLAWSPTLGGIKRPKWLRPSSCISLIDSLIANSPTQLTIIGGKDEYPAKKKPVKK
ncbi:unnamed protein product [Blepharisma stoltei]|uniref:Uncharacterized protein n=1 Tax=Blepharisma stoltei TaxID=1481888 RepID=A0AAU9IR35_9CILI|nr:unnamed protein product [Blepharisma stoltei]